MMVFQTAPRSAEEIGREWSDELLPPGSALRGPNVRAFMTGLAGPRAQLEGDIAAVCSEICPAQAQSLLDGYRRLLGPDPIGRDQGALTDAEWRYVLQQRWTARGDQRPAFYRELAKSWGIDITIEEPEPPICGPAICGLGECAHDWVRFVWIVQLPTGVLQAICGVPMSGTLEAAEDDRNQFQALQSVFWKLKPADTEVYFEHDGEWING
ncbi:DUF2313 domain-containing protein [Saccharibacter sp. 17.LH.SD]|uniref:putative phage tail protein n=1 Tax=Saccharibacter sp. 17.LH.SD TaxID=2689393 RepID=UPI00136D60D2|nr:putative phage tail protein [Saccharibacter sp. 17.LH.SD]MXV43898.1 DUF2313 domain-containing protein [Saccharibacter sp. 17.LH.SD]